jgi:hypothetical protein
MKYNFFQEIKKIYIYCSVAYLAVASLIHSCKYILFSIQSASFYCTKMLISFKALNDNTPFKTKQTQQKSLPVFPKSAHIHSLLLHRHMCPCKDPLSTLSPEEEFGDKAGFLQRRLLHDVSVRQ